MEIKKPIIFDVQPKQDNLFSVLILEGIIHKREKWDTYQFKNKNVPRVSEILKETIGKDYLMKWALRLGKETYDRESIDTLVTGTIVHEMIEHFLLYGIKKEVNYKSYNMKMKSEKAYANFVSWYRDMINKGYEIYPVMIEKTITCPWFGGTIDCIMKFVHKKYNIERTYIIDFKTSKQISIEYFLQTFAYKWAIDWNKNYVDSSLPNIDGLGIIRIDKEKDNYENLFLDYNNIDQQKILNDIELGFGSMLNWYYHLINLNYDLKIIKKMEKGIK